MASPKTFIVTDENLNAYRFRVLTSGIRTERFKNNPVMFYNHDREAGVIGKWNNLISNGSQLLSDPEFDVADKALGEKVAGKVERGFIKAASIGINILSVSTDPALMLPGQKLPTVTECELIEISVVDVPANQNALTLYDTDGNVIDLKGITDWTLFFNPNNTEMLKLTAKTITALSLSDTATAEQIEVAVATLSNRAETAEKELKKLKDEQAEQTKLRATALVDKAIADKKITAGEKDEWVKQATENLAFVEKMLAKLSAPNLPAGHTKPAQAAGATTLRDQTGGKSLRELEKGNPKLVAKIRKDDTELYEELYESQYGKKPNS